MLIPSTYRSILFRSLLLFATLTAASFFLVKEWWLGLIVVFPFLLYQMVQLFRFQQKTQQEVSDFVEAVHYRDFSRQFDVRHAPVDLQPLRQGFNDINSTVKVISKERETQYQYLQKILELVDTGILSYDVATGEVLWMNETLKRLLELPYLRSIHSLQKRNQSLFDELNTIRPSEPRIVTIRLEKMSFKALLSASGFQVDGRVSKLIAFQNVNEALDETEAQAWQKLLRVMTHEIMNSVAPIASLAETLQNRLDDAAPSLQAEAVADLELGIETIRRRSEGLLKFAETYRNLNKITTLHLQQLYISELFASLHQLMQPTAEQKGVELEIILKNPDLQLQADISLLEQVFINLLVNALEAVKEIPHPRIILSADTTLDKKIVLKVADNGPGMSGEIMEKIFIPFFSTKKTGSGIGLSLCKQIVALHKGTIQVQSAEQKGTVFTLQF